MRHMLAGAVVGATCAAQLAACSGGEEADQGVAPGVSQTDGGAETEAGGSAGADASGGGGGGGGTAGAGGAAGGGGADAGFACAPRFDLDAGAAGSAGTGSDDAGVANGYKWRDWANQVCADCVGRSLDCHDFEAGSSFDPATRVLTVELGPGIAEIVEATLQFARWSSTDPGGPNGVLAAALPMQIHENTASVDLSAQLEPGASRISGIGLLLRDACGVSSDVSSLAGDAPEGGAAIPIYCEF